MRFDPGGTEQPEYFFLADPECIHGIRLAKMDRNIVNGHRAGPIIGFQRSVLHDLPEK